MSVRKLAESGPGGKESTVVAVEIWWPRLLGAFFFSGEGVLGATLRSEVELTKETNER
jgi:hypothetical protein